MTVLVTGAARGIGFGLAEAFAARGEPVVGTCRGTPPAPHEGIEWQTLDVTNPDSHAALGRALDDRALSVLVCNAGVYPDKDHVLGDGFDPELWARAFATNVTGVFLTIQTLLPHLARTAAPKIAILGSTMGSDTRAAGGAYIYRASKAAVLNLGRNLAADLRVQGIAVGIYHPGWVRTRMGGTSADIDVDQSVAGLMARIDALDLNDTGCFRNYDGSRLDF